MLFLANLFTIALALAEHWSLANVMWIYWGQNIIIGFFNCLRMLKLREFSTQDVMMNDQPVAPTRKTRVQMAGFFALHYGFFQLAYLLFLAVNKSTAFPKESALSLGLCTIVFAVNHLFSFRYNLERDLKGKPNIGTLMFFPYARILPMHLTIIFGGFLADWRGGLVLFLGLKTAADMIMHTVEHREKNSSLYTS